MNQDAEKLKDEGNKKYTSGDYDNAILFYSKAIELDPKNATYYANRAAAYFSKESISEGIADCTHAIQLDPNYVKAYFRRGTGYLKMGELNLAQSDFQKTITLEPRNTQAKEQLEVLKRVRALLEEGSKFIRNQDWDRALSYYKTAMNLSPESADAKIGISEALLGLKKYGDASTIVTSVLQKDPNNIKALLLRGTAMFSQGHLSAAATLLGNILRLDPDNTRAMTMRKAARNIETLKKQGNDAFQAGQHEEAYKCYSEALEQAPDLDAVNSVLYANRAASLKSLGKYQEAVDDLSKALEIDPEYVKAYIRRAQCYEQLQMWQECVRDYDMAGVKDPQNKEIRGALREAKRQLKIANRKDYYKIMGISKNATDHEIKKAYRNLAREKHPDKHPSENREEAEKEFKLLQEAYGILSDQNKRAQYDNGADLEEIEQGGGFPHGHGFPGGVDINDLFGNAFFRGGGGGFNFHTSSKYQ